jgi:small-conductance mechanosensitive channel
MLSIHLIGLQILTIILGILMVIFGGIFLTVIYLEKKHGRTPVLKRVAAILAVTFVPLMCLVIYNSWRLYTINKLLTRGHFLMRQVGLLHQQLAGSSRGLVCGILAQMGGNVRSTPQPMTGL